MMDIVRKNGGFAVKLHGDEYSMAGLPDLFISYKGRGAWVEVKDDSPTSKAGNPSPIQYSVMRKIKNTGFMTFVARTPEDVWAFLTSQSLWHIFNYEIWYEGKQKSYLSYKVSTTLKKYEQFVQEKRDENFDKKIFAPIDISFGV
jgi:hypothetical protein